MPAATVAVSATGSTASNSPAGSMAHFMLFNVPLPAQPARLRPRAAARASAAKRLIRASSFRAVSVIKTNQTGPSNAYWDVKNRIVFANDTAFLQRL